MKEEPGSRSGDKLWSILKSYLLAGRRSRGCLQSFGVRACAIPLGPLHGRGLPCSNDVQKTLLCAEQDSAACTPAHEASPVESTRPVCSILHALDLSYAARFKTLEMLTRFRHLR